MKHFILVALPHIICVLIVLVSKIFYYIDDIKGLNSMIKYFGPLYILLFFLYLPISAILIEPIYSIGVVTQFATLIIFNFMFVFMFSITYKHEYKFTKKYKKI